jgi:hypothetical protein
MFASLLLLLTAAAALNARPLWAVFGVLSLVQFFNVYYAYIYFTEDNYLRVGWLFDWIDGRVFLLSLLASLAFPILLATGRFLAMREERAGEGGKG